MGRRGLGLRVSVLAVVAAAALTSAPPAFAEHETRVNTWQGICADIPGWATFDEPVGLLPSENDVLLRADFAGGNCNGTVNGEPVENGTATVGIDYRGIQTCEAAILEGPIKFTVNGVNFHGIATYQRVALGVKVMIQNIDGSGGVPIQVLVRGYGGENEPGGSDPRLDPLTDYLFGCFGGSGITEAGVIIIRSISADFRSQEPIPH